ncbi:actin-like ATPase domain-containing protein [Lophiostoma macrostomum CBS 122681]|uniref:Phosphotransferase n=1 Tax=Lophiostoma macrostomum CBS 122681 TaxID=1314788 RepID=A0A6A6SS61_9PLEO|nr:actin-like ATPase domain-containing protein [Lophiostoma macrostomum CBS 122681]
MLNDEEEQEHVEKALAALTGFINESTLLDLASRFSETYRQLAKSSVEHFLVTPVTALPSGREKGRFLSIDVGGTNLRVGFIELLGETDDGSRDAQKPIPKIKRSHDRNWPIEDHLKMDQAADLFAWIGDCIAEVIQEALDEVPAGSTDSPFGEELLLGITFSFPMAQTCLSEATLLPMGKGFGITSDLNLGEMLLAGYARHIVEPNTNGENGHASPTSPNPSTKKRRLSRLPRIRIAAITNDTVATFASLAYAVKAAPNSRVAMGLIVGTGTNATVPMKIEDLHPSKRKALADPDNVETVVINTEWTIRGTDKPLIDLSIKTKWDLALDQASDAPGFQPFEYMTAGRYLGEIVRLVFVDIVSKDLGDAQVPPSLTTRNALPTRFLSEVVARADEETLAAQLNQKYAAISSPTDFWTPARVKLLRDVAFAVQQRSSALIAAACVGLLHCVRDIRIERDDTRTATNGPGTGNGNGNGNGNGVHKDEAEANEEEGVEELVIAYAGGTISQYPEWLQTCQRWIDALVTKGSPANRAKKVVLQEALDGGIIGAGVLAGMTDDIA